jgi:hypothetical protein
MNDVTYTSSGTTIRVRLDAELMRELMNGGEEPRDEKAKATHERNSQLRELLVYRLLRSVVGEFNTKLKGRRERFKLVEEGEGLFLEVVLP